MQLRDGGEIRADLVIGTDGRASLLRRKAGLDVERGREAYDVLWFKVPRPPGPAAAGEEVQVHLRPGQLCLAFPTFDDRLQVGWILPKGSYGDLKRRGIEEWLGAVVAQVGPELGSHLRAHREALERPFVLDVVCFRLESWQRPGLLLLGDAAHPMSPVGGQGLNIALRDALVAANHLVPVLEAGADPAALDAAAPAVQAERLPEVREVQRLQGQPPRIFFRKGLWVRVLFEVAALLVRSAALRRRARTPRITDTFLNGVCEVKLRV